MTSTPHTIGTTSTIVANISPKRTSLSIFNTHATAIVYIKEGRGASSTNGIPIYPKGNVSITELEDSLQVKEQYSAISDTASTVIVVFEGFKE